MKKRIITFIVSVAVTSLFGALPLTGCGHAVKFRVTDEQGTPIEGANVLVVYQKGWMPGEGFGRDVYGSKEKRTDKYGTAYFRISPFGNQYFNYEVEDPEGRYYSSIRKEEKRLSQDGTTQIAVTLRAKRTPLKAFYQYREAPWFPQINGMAVGHNENPPLGFDAVVGDWIAPYGKGKISDFLFRSSYTESGNTYVKDSRGVLRLSDDFQYSAAFSWTFINQDDGIVEAPQCWPSSSISIAFEAPTKGYLRELRMEWHRPKRSTDFMKSKESQYFFRIRTQRDKRGNIIYALYGKLEEGFFFGSLRFDEIQHFSYTLNLEPLSRNLENNGEYKEHNNTNTESLRAHVNADYIRRFPSVLLNQSEYMRSLPTLAEEEARKKKAEYSSP